MRGVDWGLENKEEKKKLGRRTQVNSVLGELQRHVLQDPDVPPFPPRTQHRHMHTHPTVFIVTITNLNVFLGGILCDFQ